MSRTTRLIVAVAAAAALCATATSCGSDDPSSEGTDVTVFAAASLTAAFTELGDAFTAANPGTDVTLQFAASSDLATQIAEGAAADVFASADQKNMTKLVDGGNSGGTPVVFATNLLQIMVEPGNPKGVTTVADLENPELLVVVCSPEVPCGKYAETLFTNAGVTVTPASLEENVKAVVTKVTLGEADAGIVYRTDVIAVGAQAAGVDIPSDVNVRAEYPIVVTKRATDDESARSFVQFVTSDQGQAILASYGFLSP